MTILGRPALTARRRQCLAALAAVDSSLRGLDLTSQLGFWLSQAERLPGRTRAGLRQVLRTAPEAATALSMFVAGVYGAASAESAEVADALATEVGAFQRRLARTTAARRERLARSLASLLDHLAAPTDAAPQPGA